MLPFCDTGISKYDHTAGDKSVENPYPLLHASNHKRHTSFRQSEFSRKVTELLPPARGWRHVEKHIDIADQDPSLSRNLRVPMSYGWVISCQHYTLHNSCFYCIRVNFVLGYRSFWVGLRCVLYIFAFIYINTDFHTANLPV